MRKKFTRKKLSHNIMKRKSTVTSPRMRKEIVPSSYPPPKMDDFMKSLISETTGECVVMVSGYSSIGIMYVELILLSANLCGQYCILYVTTNSGIFGFPPFNSSSLLISNLSDCPTFI